MPTTSLKLDLNTHTVPELRWDFFSYFYSGEMSEFRGKVDEDAIPKEEEALIKPRWGKSGDGHYLVKFRGAKPGKFTN